ncbi:3-oxoacyl-ACP synthase III family protein [Flavilitoribacter nigricans]|uniref:3-oxoacyl-ACP synthase n=1 Tax=Flavilitoribacter nigricans (strain ATCC 23147 / DSM 23189 / NBRC 102662 / NCIMB 1420 / SS-2) TaxID=1122177 RepID=A0A2D0MYW4_FLAN2|nr:ketoacyl-ACP synthase III [Flavilitoribacter nigricans]PHN01482.1 3-oxoacyl-ACP synthase [Flavilitoribacter nigricans DSM 23189 = NBRC 102662]
MATMNFSRIGISGLAAAVPRNTINNYEYTEHFPAADVKEIVDKTGIKERRFAEAQHCASDFCFAAAEKLLTEKEVDRSEIDLLIFVSQTPDYRMPATSVVLQHRLGLPKSTAAFDINLGCSAFIYGLSTAYAFMQNPGFKKVLLLDGETRSRVYSAKDRKTAFLFGDGGVAALIERDDRFGESFFSLHSDGARENLIKMDAGGYRNPSSPETLREKVVDEHGNIRTDEHGYMNGADVFNFVLREIPKNIRSILEASGSDPADIDYWLFHQANMYMNNYLLKKLKLDSEKVPISLDKFGNTSSVSIPITMVSELQDQLVTRKKLLLSGFGVGMSWASAVLNLDNCHIPDLVEI